MKKLAIFDFDGTLFPKDTLPFLLSQWKGLKASRLMIYRTFLSFIPLFFQYKLGLFTSQSREKLKVIAVRRFNVIFDGMSKTELQDFFRSCSAKIIPLLNETVVHELKRARTEGYHTVLLSGTYHDLLQNIGDYLEADTVIGSEIPFTNGIFNSKQEMAIVIGDMKLKKIDEQFPKDTVDWKASRAYADGYSELDLIQAVGEPVVVNPDQKLKDLALANNWRMIR